MIIISIHHNCAHNLGGNKYVSNNTLVGMREVGRRSVLLVAILPLLLLLMMVAMVVMVVMMVVMVAMVAMVVMVEVMINDDDNSQIKNLLELIEGRVLLSGAIPLALLGRC